MTFNRRRRYSEGGFCLSTNWFRPRSWGIHEGPITYNVTRKRLTVRLPFGLGSWTPTRRRR